jgi:tetratricopeptide (TPR) repeat protein
MGSSAQAVAAEKRALELNPLSAEVNTILGHIRYLARDYDQAIEQLHKGLDIEPSYWFGHLLLGLAHQRKGEHAKAIAELGCARDIENAIPETLAALGHGYAVLGNRSEAERSLHELIELSEQHYVSAYLIAKVFTGLGEKSEALTWLEKAYQDRSVFVAWLKVEPEMDALRSEPRFKAILRRLAFPS